MDFSAVNGDALRSSVGTAVARKALDNAKFEGELAVAMIKDAAEAGPKNEASRGAVSGVRGPEETSGNLIDKNA
ncbi:MAG: hypothetical protein KF684_11960 [Phycisphaeraceae bacterium]|nr:hypothetical protein [Phycisphaeraceae bacterium]